MRTQWTEKMSSSKDQTEKTHAAVTFNTTKNDPPSSIGKGKSSSLLRELTSSWSSEPVCVKYSLKDDRDFIDSIARDEVANGEKCHLKIGQCSNSVIELSAIRTRNECAKMDYGVLTNDENWKKKRAQLLRQCAEYLELESVNSKFTKDNFRRGFLNKVSSNERY